MSANIAFALAAAAISLAIVVLAGLKGDWAVVAVYALLFGGFLARASFGRTARREAKAEQALASGDEGAETERPGSVPGVGAPGAKRGGPEHEPERRLGRARPKRR